MSVSKITSECVTNSIRIKASPYFIENQSNIQNNQYLYGYDISITNEGTTEVQLLSRYWLIINIDGKRQEVKGPGVVGHTPILKPGDVYSYTSFCPLDSNFGTMEGYYTMKNRDNGETFKATIGRFYLTTNNSNK